MFLRSCTQLHPVRIDAGYLIVGVNPLQPPSSKWLFMAFIFCWDIIQQIPMQHHQLEKSTSSLAWYCDLSIQLPCAVLKIACIKPQVLFWPWSFYRLFLFLFSFSYENVINSSSFFFLFCCFPGLCLKYRLNGNVYSIWWGL